MLLKGGIWLHESEGERVFCLLWVDCGGNDDRTFEPPLNVAVLLLWLLMHPGSHCRAGPSAGARASLSPQREREIVSRVRTRPRAHALKSSRVINMPLTRAALTCHAIVMPHRESQVSCTSHRA